MTSHPWLWWPLLGSLLLATVFAVGAWYYERKKARPREVSIKGFTGIVRETSKLTLIGSGAGWITSILSNDLDAYPFFRHLMSSVLIVSLTAAFLNYYLSAAIDTSTSSDGKTAKIKTIAWPILHGVIFGLSLASAFWLWLGVLIFAWKV